jgi:hypothetical protein
MLGTIQKLLLKPRIPVIQINGMIDPKMYFSVT